MPHPPPSSISSFDLHYERPKWYRLAIYDSLLWLLSVIFDCFFREIRPRGAFKIPREGPVIFVAAPHHNQFVDPVLLMNQIKKEANRRISFLIAAKSYKLKAVGTMAKCQLSIPVVRPQDCLVKGTGKIFVDFDKDPLRVIGKDTKFTKECMVKGLVALPQSLGASEIVEVISDTELIIRKEFKSSDKVKLLLTNGTTYKRADKIDQKQVYQMVFDHLLDDGCIGIFPEGGSHDRPDLLPLKAGVAVMALGAMDKNPGCNIKIVPCGMNYFNAHKFRSRAVVEFGDPIEIPKELVKKYANPETNREAVKELLDTITTGLKAVTVTCEDYETLMLIQAVRRLYAGNFAQQLPLPLIVEMNRRLVIGYQHFKNVPKVQEIKEKVLHYNDFLKTLYLPDHDVESCNDEAHKITLIPIFFFRVFKLFILFILALPGATLFSPVFLSTKIISKKKAKEALANSVVKIQANDVIATWKILVSMGIAPIVYSFYASVGTYYCSTHDYFSHWKLFWVWIFLYSCGVLVTYSALLTGEQGMDLFKSIRPLYLSITSGSSIKELKKMRHELSEEITELVNHYGPQLFPNDFNLLDLQKSLNINGDVVYADSDEEEDLKTEELRNRRIAKRKAEKKKKKTQENEDTQELQSSDMKHSSSMSDGISLLNSDNSLTNLPMFSDYILHKNAKNPDLQLDPQSHFGSRVNSNLNSGANSSVSIYDDYRFASQSEHGTASPVRYSRRPHLPETPSSDHMELNFSSKPQGQKTRLRDKIKTKLRENRKDN
ncbi:dihydroxyacetone phosphate sn-1 acyltransferase (ec 2.3.1.42), putative [Candida dubliniensis CD36]|uniref:Glycerol 3-phosphate sn-1 acyltransferase (Ec 2.3.1.15), putative n=1 Tax=Candida dubliniensis (strain CD36 / ATCC MYA-646 / CBS 7987 / NCPF 3949 / NRRL Y-17841) TaxID=573826 RepID=B9WD56_CANDC|nr:dihydroxyacetone phosphate sn-1 acyltransferase (ec 2.3.1.42), putative [Candida dubliniensis CD36]CAX42605.1 dihydroxyacetone phosphate sn-1 acyltransferase (ec 2.3.1.42), putative [Candida dubliniensis CD36]